MMDTENSNVTLRIEAVVAGGRKGGEDGKGQMGG